MTEFAVVMTKARKHYPSAPTEFRASVIPGRSITVKRVNRDGTETVPVTFYIGDIAEYDSYNLKYLGVITNITDKTVTIEPDRSAKKRLDIYSFSFRNYDFDLEKIRAHNIETSYYI